MLSKIPSKNPPSIEMTTYHRSYTDFEERIQEVDQLFFKTLLRHLNDFVHIPDLSKIVIEYLNDKFKPPARIGLSHNVWRFNTIQLTDLYEYWRGLSCPYFKLEIERFSCLFRIRDHAKKPTGNFRLQFGHMSKLGSFGVITEYPKPEPNDPLKKDNGPFFLKQKTKENGTYVSLSRSRFYTLSMLHYYGTPLKITLFNSAESAFNNHFTGLIDHQWGDLTPAFLPEMQEKEHQQFITAQTISIWTVRRSG